MAKVSWIIASAIILVSGVMHLYGIFFSEDLFPENKELITLMMSSNIQMDKTGNLWKLWIGFNAMFSAGLIFIGAVFLALSIKHFAFLRERHFLVLLNIVTLGFFVWIGHTYVINDFVIAMVVPLVLFIGGYVAIVLIRPVKI